MHEVVGRASISIADEPARHQLRFCINCRPRPDIAPALLALAIRHVLFLAAHKRPNFVALDALAIQVAESGILKLGTNFAEIGQELHHRRAMHARHASCGAEAVAFNQAGNHSNALFGRDLVHEFKVASHA